MIVVLAVFACAPDAALPFGSTAEDCASCHVAHGDEWAASRHGQSTGSPVFQAMLPAVEDAWGGFARKTCEGCHAPGHGGDTTIGCVSCHAADGNHAERDGKLAVDLTEPLSGPFGLGAGEAHTTIDRGFLDDSALCATCHTVTGPELLVEDTMAELAASDLADRSCVDCHLPVVGARALTPETAPRVSHDHRMVGVDPPWDTDPTDPVAAEATRALLASALTLRVEAGEVVVTNTGGGHRVPTGVSFLRDLWVDADGIDGTTTLLRLGDQPTHGGVDVPLLVDADAVRHGSLASGESARATLPAATTAVHLRARAVRLDVLDALDLSALAETLPVHEIATVTVGN